MKDFWKNFKKENRKNQSGNVLFLILIAVVLFAALSYAVTSSTNSSGGNVNEEANLVSSAAVTQYPSSIKTAIIRMMVSGGYDAEDLYFDKPPYTNLAATAQGVFHPSGGGATYTNASADVMASDGGNTGGVWYFNRDFEIVNIGTSANDNAGNDIVAFLPGIKTSICEKINSELGIPNDATSTLTSDITVTTMQTEDDAADDEDDPAVNGIGTALGAAAIDGQPYGCYTMDDGTHTYYHVLLER